MMSEKMLVGSIHRYDDGYGNGCRWPTSRNAQSLPASVPQFRHPPDSERYLNGIKSKVQIKSDEASLKRNAEQVVFQTSGEIGKFLIDYDEGTKLNMQPLRRYKPQVVHKTCQDSSIIRQTAREVGTSRNNTARTEQSNNSISFCSSGNYGGTTSQETYLETLNKLDKAFDKWNRRDLFAASLPAKQEHEQRWTATSNHQSSLQSKHWAEKLRRDPSN